MTEDVPASGISEPAPAKVNLYLHVGAKRSDGYHDLESLVVFTAFGDRVGLAPADGLRVERRGEFADVLPADMLQDLCYRAAANLAAALGRDANVAIVLDKEIPVAAGVGGGSADAAAVLRALCRVWGVPPDDARVIDVARKLGADVPMCLAAHPSFASGVGERLEPIAGAPAFEMLLVNPGTELSTAAVFDAYDAPPDNATLAGPVDLAGGIDAIRDSSRNDLEGPAISLCPVIADVREALVASPGCRLARMSGSGPTCFAIFESADAVAAAAGRISAAHPDWWVRATRTRAGAPVYEPL